MWLQNFNCASEKFIWARHMDNFKTRTTWHHTSLATCEIFSITSHINCCKGTLVDFICCYSACYQVKHSLTALCCPYLLQWLVHESETTHMKACLLVKKKSAEIMLKFLFENWLPVKNWMTQKDFCKRRGASSHLSVSLNSRIRNPQQHDISGAMEFWSTG